MFLIKKMFNTPTHQTKIYSTNYWVMHHIIYKKIEASLFVFKVVTIGRSVIKTLKNVKHINILSIIKYNESRNEISIYTPRLIPFSHVFSRNKEMFNKYTLCVVATTLIFLHDRLKLIHNTLCIDSLFVDKAGTIILGGFEKAMKISSDSDIQIDEHQFKKLVETILGIMNIRSHLIYLEKYKNEVGIFEELNNITLRYKILTPNEKLKFIEFMRMHKNEFIEQAKQNVVDLMAEDLFNENETITFKPDILSLIFELDLEKLDEYIEMLFCVLDSKVRLYLLHNINVYKNKVKDWNSKIFKNMVLGIKCTDTNLRIETIKAFNKISNKLDDGNNKILLKALSDLKDSSSMLLALKFIQQNVDCFISEFVIKDLYKLIMGYLCSGKNKKECIKVINMVYKNFKIKNIFKEVIPVIANLLGEAELQDDIFNLLDEILIYLKENKEKLLDAEWGVRSIKKLSSMFGTNKKSIELKLEETKIIKTEKSRNDKKNINDNLNTYTHTSNEENTEKTSESNEWDDWSDE
ncbi:N-terminal kinase-like protein [Astathelohania contejeani]|uniref:N-terminal kinase-like protein n=1 Tax=Astathelohania contejeani TaxID=164912 RepID=A0ABQ7I0Z4_9MICR|nr:N-terminal kinase-like protein [Thelohania contejeani]